MPLPRITGTPGQRTADRHPTVGSRGGVRGAPPELYGSSADIGADDVNDETFAEALERIKAQSRHYGPASKPPEWRPPILQALLDYVIIPRRRAHFRVPSGGYSQRELKEAQKLRRQWAEARLNGLRGDDATIIKWIRLSDGQQPRLAAELSRADMTPDEASLQLGYGGRIDTRWPSVFQRYRDRQLNRSEAIAAVRLWRQNHAAS